MYDVFMLTTTRTQLLLEPWQLEALRAAAEQEGESISSLVRRILTRHLGGARGAAPRLQDLEGCFDDPGLDGRDHDHALYGAAEEPAVPAREPPSTTARPKKTRRNPRKKT